MKEIDEADDSSIIAEFGDNRDDGWTSEILEEIKECDEASLKLSVKMAWVRTHVSKELPMFVCDGHYHPVCKQSKVCLEPIRETFEDDVEEDKIRYTLDQIQSKISSASCHKRRRGYDRRYQQQLKMADALKDTSGLVRCEVQGVEKAQNDTGATHNITDNKTALHNYTPIPKLPIAGIASEGTAIYAIGRGYLPVQSDEGDILMVECLYSPHAAGTLVSPTAIALQYDDIYTGWSLYANTANDTGYLQFINHDGVNHASVTMYCEDSMWFHYLKNLTFINVKHAHLQK